jgi:hypothetical protein
MEKISLEQFTAEIETSLSNYAETNDIDKISIKTWVIQALRKFGKNICEKNETVVEVKNSRALLPETFKSLTFAVKMKTKPFTEEETKQLVTERKYIENPTQFDILTMDYVVNYCETKIVTEKIYTNVEPTKFYGYELLALAPHINKNTVDVDCYNLHPLIAKKPNEISISARTLSANFKEGFIYLRYNSLPMDENGEPAIPVFSTGEILEYCELFVKVRIAESLIANNKNPSGLGQLYQMWKQEEKLKYHAAQTESKYNGLSKGWDRRFFKQTLFNRKRLGL